MVVTISIRMPTLTWSLLRDVTKHGLRRSANYAFSQRASSFYEFLNNRFPRDTRALIQSRDHGLEALTGIHGASIFSETTRSNQPHRGLFGVRQQLTAYSESEAT